MIGKIFTKTASVKIISKEETGYKVCNVTDTEQKDTWIIPFDVFASTYEESC